MLDRFYVDVSLRACFASNVERAHLVAPHAHVLKVFASIVFAAYALHLRLVWDRIQALLIFTLLLVATLVRRDIPLRRYYNRKQLSTYERTHLTLLETKWHLHIVA